MIFNVQKCSIHDGCGIRTLVFFKGCPCGARGALILNRSLTTTRSRSIRQNASAAAFVWSAAPGRR